ncbi:MAG: alpha/beta hydrolase, partial [Gluconacetobacter diazotrophicus]|nr:alpha/beta hydrolase [Gluconacetobacter diazotrophicus]
RLLHGLSDDVVPWRRATEIAGRVEAEDCRVVLVKNGDPRLSGPAELILLRDTVAELVGGG